MSECKLKRKYPDLIIECCPVCQEVDENGALDGMCCNHILCNEDCWVMCGNEMDRCPQSQECNGHILNESTLVLDEDVEP